MEKEKLLVSSCLLGELVKYNGSHNGFEQEIIDKLYKKYEIYPFCPEVEGGLLTPRTPCEIVSNEPLKVINKEGEDKTSEFVKGAKKALEVCKTHNIKKALMKENSPSCSNTQVSDGTFTSTRIDGLGVSVKILSENGIKIYNEREVKELLLAENLG